MESPNNEASAIGPCKRFCRWLKSVPLSLWGKMVEFAWRLVQLGKEDPRRVIHSIKVGLTITFVSIFYYFQPLYNGLGDAAMWAVLTVVVVFEFSVGKPYICFKLFNIYFSLSWERSKFTLLV